mmetsp:Transcript_6770/g.16295  ORF Transcript_6770/g.16295 Transcript_6770/m.16295 type:complete len:396 (+) Transcript_6770:503-1690(+)
MSLVSRVSGFCAASISASVVRVALLGPVLAGRRLSATVRLDWSDSLSRASRPVSSARNVSRGTSGAREAAAAFVAASVATWAWCLRPSAKVLSSCFRMVLMAAWTLGMREASKQFWTASCTDFCTAGTSCFAMPFCSVDCAGPTIAAGSCFSSSGPSDALTDAAHASDTRATIACSRFAARLSTVTERLPCIFRIPSLRLLPSPSIICRVESCSRMSCSSCAACKVFSMSASLRSMASWMRFSISVIRLSRPPVAASTGDAPAAASGLGWASSGGIAAPVSGCIVSRNARVGANGGGRGTSAGGAWSLQEAAADLGGPFCPGAESASADSSAAEDAWTNPATLDLTDAGADLGPASGSAVDSMLGAGWKSSASAGRLDADMSSLGVSSRFTASSG